MSKRVALVIGSGSVKCAAAIGLLNVLQREGIGLDMVVGCSGGSLYAATIALGYDAQTIAEMTSRLWTREVSQRRSFRSVLQVVLPGLFGFNEKFGLLDDRLVMARLQAAFGEKTFAEANLPLYVTATDFANGDLVTLSQGKLVDALRASIAMPYIFPAHKVGDRLLVDGYLSDPLPVSVAMREGANVIVAIGFESPYQSRLNSLPRFSMQINSIMANNLFRSNYAFNSMAHHSEVIAIVPEFNQRIRLFDTEKIPYIIQEGERATAAQLPYLHRLLSETS